MRIVKSVNWRSERSHPDGASTRKAPSRTVKLFAVEFSTTQPFNVPSKSGTNGTLWLCRGDTERRTTTNAAVTDRLRMSLGLGVGALGFGVWELTDPYFFRAALVTFQLLAFVDDV